MEILVFDVNETLLDLAGLDHHFERLFGDATARQRWFQELLQAAMVETLTGSYVDFATLADAALARTAWRWKADLSSEDRGEILGQLPYLQPHPDVPPALRSLEEAGFRLAALTNSPYRTVRAQLDNADLARFFERVLSVDEVRVFKPHPAVYRMAAKRLEVKPADLRLVAAHAWDVSGAMRAGAKAAYVRRTGRDLDALDERPDVVGQDLTEVAETLRGLRR